MPSTTESFDPSSRLSRVVPERGAPQTNRNFLPTIHLVAINQPKPSPIF
jgi:hypothetical protein